MAKYTLWDIKFVLIGIVMFFALIVGSLINEFNYLDAAYLLFLITCIIRYIIICRQDRN